MQALGVLPTTGSRPRAEPDIKPTRERRRRGKVERVEGRNSKDGRTFVDDAGQVASPFRAVDTLELMRRQGTITEDMQKAGDEFRDNFAQAHLEALKAADPGRISGASFLSTGGPSGAGIQRARDSVWSALQAVGGLRRRGGSCIWHILGLEWSLPQWAATQGGGMNDNGTTRTLNVKEASGILKCALDILAEK